MAADVSRVSYRPKLLLFAAATLVLVLLALLPLYIGLYQTQLLTYGLIAAIAALGFTLPSSASAPIRLRSCCVMPASVRWSSIF